MVYFLCNVQLTGQIPPPTTMLFGIQGNPSNTQHSFWRQSHTSRSSRPLPSYVTVTSLTPTWRHTLRVVICWTDRFYYHIVWIRSTATSVIPREHLLCLQDCLLYMLTFFYRLFKTSRELRSLSAVQIVQKFHILLYYYTYTWISTYQKISRPIMEIQTVTHTHTFKL